MFSTIALLAAAAAATPAAEPARPLTAQQRFDQAVALANDGKCTDAIAAFEALENKLKAGSLPEAVAAVRKGQCMIRMGRTEAGEMAIRQGLPALRKQEGQFKADVASALISLGDAALARWDYAGARRSYEEAQALPEATHPVVINLRLAQAMMFDGGEAPLHHADLAIKILEAAPGADKDQLAQYRTIKARILLNQGRNEEAYAELKQALKLSGGLGLKVSLSDVAMRGDLALAAQLAGDKSKAREYLAYTGAGRIAESPFAVALSMEPPVCGAQTGLQRDDFAIVDFAIESDGHVIGAKTVYTRGSAEVAAEFARAVSKWTWDPARLKDIPAFYLYAPRVELRCTTQGESAPGLMTPITQRFIGWSAQQLGLGGAQTKETIRAMLGSLADQSEAASSPVQQVAALGLLTLYQPMPNTARYAMIDRAMTLSSPTPVPGEMRNMLKITQMGIRLGRDRSDGSIPAAPRGGMATLLDDPEIIGDALAADTVRLLVATSRDDGSKSLDKGQLLKAVVDDTRLPDQHPLKQSAHLALANLAARVKDYDAAQSYFKATGLSEEQCAYLGLRPALRTSGLGSEDFPAEALQFGFEGWVGLEFDVGANGRAVDARPVFAYPPFIFSESAAKSAGGFRFESSYRPGGSVACTANRHRLIYRLP